MTAPARSCSRACPATRSDRNRRQGRARLSRARSTVDGADIDIDFEVDMLPFRYAGLPGNCGHHAFRPGRERDPDRASDGGVRPTGPYADQMSKAEIKSPLPGMFYRRPSPAARSSERWRPCFRSRCDRRRRSDEILPRSDRVDGKHSFPCRRCRRGDGRPGACRGRGMTINSVWLPIGARSRCGSSARRKPWG